MQFFPNYRITLTWHLAIEPKLLGVHNTHNVYLCHGKYGEYLRHNSLNYSIPQWAKMENLNEPFGIAQASNIIDWKIRNKVPRGEAVCKEIDVSENECPWYTKDTL
jgi:topoisomerase IA-like protein